MRVGVLGVGNWGKNVARTFAELGALGAVADANPELRALAADAHGVPGCQDLPALLASGVEAVAIATPAPTHFVQAQEALRAGKDVFVEKPVTLNADEARRLADLAAAEGRVLMVGHLMLYQSAIAWMREQIVSGLIGDLRSIHQVRLNLGKARAVENALWSLGVHDVAVALYLAGSEVKTVSAAGQAALQPGVEDDVYLHLGFDNGVQAHIRSSWLWPVRQRGLTAVGTRGMLVYDEADQTVTHHRKWIDESLRNVDEGSSVAFTGDSAPLKRELQHFLECCKERKAPISDGGSGARVIEVLERAAAKELAAR